MGTKKISPQITNFLESYRTAFERLDAEAIADLFVYPLHITGDDDPVKPESIGSREEWTIQLRGLLSGYRSMQFSSANILHLYVLEFSPRLFQIKVHWELHDRAEAPLYDFTAVYTLVEMGENLRVTAIAHNELTRLHAHLNSTSKSA